MNRFIRIFATVVAFLLLASSCRNERSLDVSEGSAILSVGYEFNDFDETEMTLRSHMRPEDEARINEIVFWVLDADGNVEGFYGPYDAVELGYLPKPSAPSTGGGVGKGVTLGGTAKRGKLNAKIDLSQLGSGEKSIIGLANYSSTNFTVADRSGKVFNGVEAFKQLKSRADFNMMVVNTNPNNRPTASTERYSDLLMVADQKVSAEDIYKQHVVIRFVPYVAKFSLKVIAGPDIEVHNLNFHIENVPTITPLAIGQTSLTDEEMKFANTEVTKVPYLVQDGQGFFISQGYITPNDRKPTTPITLADVQEAQKNASKATSKNSGFNAFDLRQKQVKTPAKFGYLENGDPKFAPKHSTNIVIHATLVDKKTGSERLGELTYRIALGDFSGVSSWTNPTEDDLNKINNFLVETATHYFYNITINGVNNVVVEAKSHSIENEIEPNPSVEGTVIDTNNNYELDAHYEQRTVILSADQFGLFKSPNSREFKDDATASFVIRTPFEDLKTISYTRAEALELGATEGASMKVCDNDWIRVVVHKPEVSTNWDYTNVPNILYSKTHDPKKYNDVGDYYNATLTVEQFIYLMMSNPEQVFDTKNKVALTFFFNEYFYDKAPKTTANPQGGATIDTSLWKTFANAPDRLFIFLNGSEAVSADQNSTYVGNVIASFAQHSIKTVFQDTETGLQVWGVESIDEHPNRIFSDYLPTTNAFWYNYYESNAWVNTWNLLAGDIAPQSSSDGKGGGWTKYSANSNYGKGKQWMKFRHNTFPVDRDKSVQKYWSTMTQAHVDGLDMREESNKQALYTPLLRNRDYNRDDIMQASELKWVIPSSAESFIIGVANNFFPDYAKLTSPKSSEVKFENAPLLMFTSSARNVNYMDRSSVNPMTLVVQNLSILPVKEIINTYYEMKISTWKNDVVRTTTRLIRFMGYVDDVNDTDVTVKGKTYHIQGNGADIMADTWKYNINSFVQYLPNVKDPAKANQFDCGGVFKMPNLDPNFVRAEVVNRELPLHTEKDSAMRFYAKGFRVAKQYHEWAKKDHPAGGSMARYGIKYRDLADKIRSGNAPCKTYTEEPLYADLGKWRLPNYAEMVVMGFFMPFTHWDNANAKTDPAIAGTAGPRAIWTRTEPSYNLRGGRGGTSTRTSGTNFFLYTDGTALWPMAMEIYPFGNRFSSADGWIRCVRDIDN